VNSEVRHTRRFEKDFISLDKSMKKRVIEVVKLLRGNPYIGKQLKGPL